MTRRRVAQAIITIYGIWAVAILAVFGLTNRLVPVALLGAGITSLAAYAGGRALATRRRQAAQAPGITPEQFVTLMRELGAGDLEHRGTDS